MSVADLHEHSWDSLAPYAAIARAHPGGLVDLTVGNPIDPAPTVARRALATATDAHRYPAIEGSPDLLGAIAAWYARRRGVPGLEPAQIMPTIGSKELVALLPLLLGIGPGAVVVRPSAAYPTYEIGAQLVGATTFAGDDPARWPTGTRLVWINSPGNPTGQVLDADQLRAAVAAARALGAVLAHDECYAELPWADQPVPSVLDPAITGGEPTGLISVYSLSKQSNLAGLRGAFLAGDPAIVGRVLSARRHLGLWPPDPVQAAMAATLADDTHVAAQRERYRRRREVLLAAVRSAGFRVDHSEAGLFLWVTEGRDAWDSVGRLANLGILAVPGPFYGIDSPQHVRLALTATDEAIAAAAHRLRSR